MKLKARKAAARTELDAALLLRDFEQDLLVGLGKVAFSDGLAGCTAGSVHDNGQTPKRSAPFPSSQPYKSSRTYASDSAGGRSGFTPVKHEGQEVKREAIQKMESKLLKEAAMEEQT